MGLSLLKDGSLSDENFSTNETRSTQKELQNINNPL